MMKTRADEMKQNFFKNLNSKVKVSIVCDVWTSLNHLAFLKIIVYFVDKDWKYREILIAPLSTWGRPRGPPDSVVRMAG